MASLADELLEWRRWADTTPDKGEADGWESHYPDWSRLIGSAVVAMGDAAASPTDWALVEEVWRMSSEDQDMAEIARTDPDRYRAALERLAHSKEPDARWQVYEVLGDSTFGAEILRRAIETDVDAYCRRRAIVGYAELAKRQVAISRDIHGKLTEWLGDPDEYIRTVAFGIAVDWIAGVLQDASVDPSSVVQHNLRGFKERLARIGAG